MDAVVSPKESPHLPKFNLEPTVLYVKNAWLVEFVPNIIGVPPDDVGFIQKLILKIGLPVKPNDDVILLLLPLNTAASPNLPAA